MSPAAGFIRPGGPHTGWVPVEFRNRAEPCSRCGNAVVLTRVVQAGRHARRAATSPNRAWSAAHSLRQDPGIGVDGDCPFTGGADVRQRNESGT